jgi:2-polyprenyl-6-hydroxyphenyl methylase/3-demethylubiquinone-9 3-methyltransferase
MMHNNQKTPQSTGSVLADEVAQFNALAAQWWDESGPMAPLHRINPVRLQFIRDALGAHFGETAQKTDAFSPPLAGLRLLDIGCGAGVLSEPLARMGASVTGVDAAAEAIQVATDHAATQKLTITYRHGSVENLVAERVQFDVVCALEIIEHVAEPAAFVAQVMQLVRPGGMVIFSTLNRTRKSYALGIVAAEYLLGWVPRGTHQWKKFVTPSELARWVRLSGGQMVQLSGLVYDGAQRHFVLRAEDVGVNYLLAAYKPS